MTDDKRSQEAEDVSLREARRCDGPITEVEQAAEEILLARMRAWKGWRDEAEEIIPILARLVREGQIRELEAAAKECCPGCEWDTPRKGPYHDGAPPITLDIHGSGRGLCRALPIIARIAALRQEG